MTHHPKERPNSLSRRGFLLRSAGAAAAFSGAGPLLAACGNTTSVTQEHQHGRRTRRAGRPAAREARQARDPAALGGSHRVGARAGDRRDVHRLQLSRLPLQEGPHGLRGQVRRRSPVHAVRQRQLRTPAACLRSGHARRDGDHAGHARYRRRRQADQAAQPRLHPEPQEEHLAAARRPVLRRRVALHRSLHRLRHRHRMADGRDQRGHRRHGPAVGHLLGVSGVQGQGGAPLREPGDDRHGAPAQGDHGHQHRGSRRS